MAKVLDNKCPSCKSPVVFKPKLGKFKCDYCGNVYTADEMRNMEETEKKHQQEIEKNPHAAKDGAYVNYNCPDCGATVIADENTSATFCVYCGNTNIIKNRLSGEFKPSKIIPFKTEKEEAIAAFKALKKGRPFIPKEFLSEKNIEKIQGIYIPFWLFDIETTGSITGTAKNIKTWISGNTHYTKTDYYDVAREGNMNYSKIPVDGSKRFDNDIMNTIEPFNYDDLVDYNHAYLAGFLAEKYDVNNEEAYIDAEKRSINSTEDVLSEDIKGYTTKSITEKNIVSNKINDEYVLLPVYMVNVKYEDKYYIFAMNGQTGEFVGNIPLDKKKAWIFGISLTTIIGFICFIIHLLVFLGGE